MSSFNRSAVREALLLQPMGAVLVPGSELKAGDKFVSDVRPNVNENTVVSNVLSRDGNLLELTYNDDFGQQWESSASANHSWYATYLEADDTVAPAEEIAAVKVIMDRVPKPVKPIECQELAGFKPAATTAVLVHLDADEDDLHRASYLVLQLAGLLKRDELESANAVIRKQSPIFHKEEDPCNIDHAATAERLVNALAEADFVVENVSFIVGGFTFLNMPYYEDYEMSKTGPGRTHPGSYSRLG